MSLISSAAVLGRYVAKNVWKFIRGLHTYIHTCMVCTFHTFQNLVQVTTGCAVGHENTKYAEVL